MAPETVSASLTHPCLHNLASNIQMTPPGGPPSFNQSLVAKTSALHTNVGCVCTGMPSHCLRVRNARYENDSFSTFLRIIIASVGALYLASAVLCLLGILFVVFADAVQSFEGSVKLFDPFVGPVVDKLM